MGTRLGVVTFLMRAASSTGDPMRVPALNGVIAAIKTGRVLNRCRRKPVNGMTTAIVSVKAVVSHCAADAVMVRFSRVFLGCVLFHFVV